MGGSPGFIESWVERAQALLDRVADRLGVCGWARRSRSSKRALASSASILARERDALIEAFENEDDPIRRFRILLGITEIEAALEKKGRLKE